jgi:hypothetical protein
LYFFHRTEYYVSEDNITEGEVTLNGSWTRVFSLLHRFKVDFYIPVMMTSEMDAMAFAVPLIEIKYVTGCECIITQHLSQDRD